MISLRRRLTAAAVCVFVVLAGGAYTVRSASDAANEAPMAPIECPAKQPCLDLLGD